MNSPTSVEVPAYKSAYRIKQKSGIVRGWIDGKISQFPRHNQILPEKSSHLQVLREETSICFTMIQTRHTFSV
jgi:hypothetical protein